LASLPSLKSLYFRTCNIDSTQTNVIPTFVSQINLVHIAAPSLSVLAHCFDNIRFLCCRSVALDIDRNFLGLQYDPLVVPGLIISFSECFSPTLEHLSIGFNPVLYHLQDEEILADPRFAYSFDMVAPLLSFSRLTKVDLD
jgi:hypothetical protein